MQSFHEGTKIFGCSSAFSVRFCQCRQLGFLLLFSLSTNPLYPNGAVLNISRHTERSCSFLGELNNQFCLALWYPQLSAAIGAGSAPSSVGLRGVWPATASFLSSWRRAFKAGTACPAGAEGAVVAEKTRESGNPPALPKSLQARSLQPCLLSAQSLF